MNIPSVPNKRWAIMCWLTNLVPQWMKYMCMVRILETLMDKYGYNSHMSYENALDMYRWHINGELKKWIAKK